MIVPRNAAAGPVNRPRIRARSGGGQSRVPDAIRVIFPHLQYTLPGRIVGAEQALSRAAEETSAGAEQRVNLIIICQASLACSNGVCAVVAEELCVTKRHVDRERSRRDP